MKNMKKLFALGLTVAMTASLLAGCGGGSTTENAGSAAAGSEAATKAASNGDVNITIFNSRMWKLRQD